MGPAVLLTDKGKGCHPAGGLPEYRSVFHRLDQPVPDDGAGRTASSGLLPLHAEIYYQRCDGRICQGIGRSDDRWSGKPAGGMSPLTMEKRSGG